MQITEMFYIQRNTIIQLICQLPMQEEIHSQPTKPMPCSVCKCSYYNHQVFNQLVCYQCQSQFHQYCYAPNFKKDRNFKCDECRIGKKGTCFYCAKGGSLKHIEGDVWVHVLCGLTSSKTCLISYQSLDFILHSVEMNPSISNDHFCDYCCTGDSSGWPCAKNGCLNRAHVYCLFLYQYGQVKVRQITKVHNNLLLSMSKLLQHLQIVFPKKIDFVQKLGHKNSIFCRYHQSSNIIEHSQTNNNGRKCTQNDHKCFFSLFQKYDYAVILNNDNEILRLPQIIHKSLLIEIKLHKDNDITDEDLFFQSNSCFHSSNLMVSLLCSQQNRQIVRNYLFRDYLKRYKQLQSRLEMSQQHILLDFVEDQFVVQILHYFIKKIYISYDSMKTQILDGLVWSFENRIKLKQPNEQKVIQEEEMFKSVLIFMRDRLRKSNVLRKVLQCLTLSKETKYQSVQELIKFIFMAKKLMKDEWSYLKYEDQFKDLLHSWVQFIYQSNLPQNQLVRLFRGIKSIIKSFQIRKINFKQPFYLLLQAFSLINTHTRLILNKNYERLVMGIQLTQNEQNENKIQRKADIFQYLLTGSICVDRNSQEHFYYKEAIVKTMRALHLITFQQISLKENEKQYCQKVFSITMNRENLQRIGLKPTIKMLHYIKDILDFFELSNKFIYYLKDFEKISSWEGQFSPYVNISESLEDQIKVNTLIMLLSSKASQIAGFDRVYDITSERRKLKILEFWAMLSKQLLHINKPTILGLIEIKNLIDIIKYPPNSLRQKIQLFYQKAIKIQSKFKYFVKRYPLKSMSPEEEIIYYKSNKVTLQFALEFASQLQNCHDIDVEYELLDVKQYIESYKSFPNLQNLRSSGKLNSSFQIQTVRRQFSNHPIACTPIKAYFNILNHKRQIKDASFSICDDEFVPFKIEISSQQISTAIKELTKCRKHKKLLLPKVQLYQIQCKNLGKRQKQMLSSWYSKSYQIQRMMMNMPNVKISQKQGQDLLEQLKQIPFYNKYFISRLCKGLLIHKRITRRIEIVMRDKAKINFNTKLMNKLTIIYHRNVITSDLTETFVKFQTSYQQFLYKIRRVKPSNYYNFILFCEDIKFLQFNDIFNVYRLSLFYSLSSKYSKLQEQRSQQLKIMISQGTYLKKLFTNKQREIDGFIRLLQRSKDYSFQY